MVSDRDATQRIAAADGIDIPSWDARLLPLARDDTGGAVALDLETGAVCVTQYEDPDPEVVAPSFEAWLALWADELEAGEQTIEATENGGGVEMTWLVRRDD
jgi:cell wall assembly regulator SMI1